MSQEIKFGEFAGLSFSAMPSAAIGFLLLWIVLSIFAAAVLQLSIGKAILGGLVAALLHLVAEILHQLGHAWAARRTGHPMIGVRLWGVLSTAVYPKDEPDLPAAMHIRRALGGPQFSLVISVIAAVIVLIMNSRGGTLWWIALFFFLDNFLTFTLGSFLPLGFTDGSTLLHWRNKQ